MKGILYSAFRQMREGKELLPASAVSQVSSKYYFKVAYFGGAYSDPLHLLEYKLQNI